MRQDLQDVYSEWMMKGAELGYRRDIEIRKCPHREGESMLIFTQSNMNSNGQGNRVTLSRVFHTWGQSTRKNNSREDIYRLRKLFDDLEENFEELRNSAGDGWVQGMTA